MYESVRGRISMTTHGFLSKLWICVYMSGGNFMIVWGGKHNSQSQAVEKMWHFSFFVFLILVSNKQLLQNAKESCEMNWDCLQQPWQKLQLPHLPKMFVETFHSLKDFGIWSIQNKSLGFAPISTSCHSRQDDREVWCNVLSFTTETTNRSFRAFCLIHFLELCAYVALGRCLDSICCFDRLQFIYPKCIHTVCEIN